MGSLSMIDFEPAFQYWKGLAKYTKGEDCVLLDLGHSTINALFAKVGPAGEVAVLDYASVEESGYSDGAIVNQALFEKAVRRVVGDLKARNRIKIKSFDVVLSAPFISYFSHFVTVNLSPNKRITLKMVKETISGARAEVSSLADQVIQVVPVRYALDSIYSGNEPPLGFEGNQLGIELVFITAPSASLDQIERSFNECGFQVKNWHYSGISAAESVVVPASEAGVAVVDIGHGSTDVSVYQNGKLLHVSVLGRGGREIDSDLAVYLNESINVAENVKRNFGCALPQVIKYNEFIDLRGRGFTANKMVPAREIAVVVRNRVQEMLFAIDEEISKAINPEQISRVIFTGGTAKITGFTDLAEEVLERHVELGMPCAVNGTRMGFSDPACASLIGTLRKLRNIKLEKIQLDHSAMTASEKIRSWFGAIVSVQAARQR